MDQSTTLQLVSDRLAVSDLVARFSDAANRRDGPAFRALWTDDAVWTIGSPIDVSVTGGDEITRTFMSLMQERWELFAQIPSAAHVIDVDGDTATARLYLMEIAQSRDHVGNRNVSVYEDLMTRSDDGWKFAHRDYKTLYFDETPLPGHIQTDT